MSLRSYNEALQNWHRARIASEGASARARLAHQGMTTAWELLQKEAARLTKDERALAAREQFHGGKA